MGQSGFMVKKRNLRPLLSFSTLLVCILPHCRLRDWCGNLRKASGHMVRRLDQSASFRIFDSTFYFPHSTIPHFTHSLYGHFGTGTLRYQDILTLIVHFITKTLRHWLMSQLRRCNFFRLFVTYVYMNRLVRWHRLYKRFRLLLRQVVCLSVTLRYHDVMTYSVSQKIPPPWGYLIFTRATLC